DKAEDVRMYADLSLIRAHRDSSLYAIILFNWQKIRKDRASKEPFSIVERVQDLPSELLDFMIEEAGNRFSGEFRCGAHTVLLSRSPLDCSHRSSPNRADMYNAQSSDVLHT